jgi:hypothetical protein
MQRVLTMLHQDHLNRHYLSRKSITTLLLEGMYTKAASTQTQMKGLINANTASVVSTVGQSILYCSFLGFKS